MMTIEAAAGAGCNLPAREQIGCDMESWDWLIPVGFIVGWLALQRWILPRFGVRT